MAAVGLFLMKQQQSNKFEQILHGKAPALRGDKDASTLVPAMADSNSVAWALLPSAFLYKAASCRASHRQVGTSMGGQVVVTNPS